MKTYEIMLNEERNVQLTAYIQGVEGEYSFKQRPAILILPGGGYAMCSDKEADPVAFAFLKAGYQAFVLRYTVTSNGTWPLPLQDYEDAMALIEERAKEWHIANGKVVVAGFSAGGHLAACAATMAEHRPAATILGYPAILKGVLDMCQPSLPCPAEQVDTLTPPCFVFACRDDSIVPIENTLAFLTALANKGIRFESRIYSYGDHGFSTGDAYQLMQPISPRATAWVSDSIDWLKEVLGEFTADGISEPRYGSLMNGNAAPTLSVECTMEYLWEQPEAVQNILAQINQMIAAVAVERGMTEENLRYALRQYTLRMILQMVNIPEDMVTTLDTALRQIPNISE